MQFNKRNFIRTKTTYWLLSHAPLPAGRKKACNKRILLRTTFIVQHSEQGIHVEEKCTAYICPGDSCRYLIGAPYSNSLACPESGLWHLWHMRTLSLGLCLLSHRREAGAMFGCGTNGSLHSCALRVQWGPLTLESSVLTQLFSLIISQHRWV